MRVYAEVPYSRDIPALAIKQVEGENDDEGY